MSELTPPLPSAPDGSEPPAFPPATIEAFLRFCAGEWMSLRSQLALGISGDDDDSWHTSERGELVVTYLDSDGPGAEGPGGLQVAAKRDGSLQAPTSLSFAADGRFDTSRGGEGRWSLWPDGSLELVLDGPDGEIREKIWFTKPNLRLRSTVETRTDGAPGRASFSSEIRRVSRPA
jgi:hypothetical protein